LKKYKKSSPNQEPYVSLKTCERKKWKTPKISELDLIETKGGYLDWNFESPDWLPLSHS
jgi:hypothetical protein